MHVYIYDTFSELVQDAIVSLGVEMRSVTNLQHLSNQIIIVNTSPPQRLVVVKRALQNRNHVFSMPLLGSGQKISELYGLAERNGVVLYFNDLRIFDDSIRRFAKEVVGKDFRLLSLTSRYKYEDMYDHMYYEVFSLLFVTKMQLPCTVSTIGAIKSPIANQRIVSITLGYRNPPFIAVLHIMTRSNDAVDYRIELISNQENVYRLENIDEYHTQGNKSRDRFIVSQMNTLQNFLRVVGTRATLLDQNYLFNMRCLKIMDAIKKSFDRNGQIVDV